MKKFNFQFEYTRFDSINELDEQRQKLIRAAEEIAKKAHVPYSHFRVGAAVLLENEEILTGNNQENASYPVGICAERTLLSYVSAQHPNLKKIILAVSVLDTGLEASPCGLCRQTIMEYESLQKQPIEILLHNNSGTVTQIPSGASLLPLHFDSDRLS